MHTHTHTHTLRNQWGGPVWGSTMEKPFVCPARHWGGTFERRRQKDLELSHPGPRARTGAPQGMKRKPESAVLAQDKDAVRPGPGDTLCPLIHRLL